MIETRSQRPGPAFAGAIFGNYRIIEPLDRGGMGSVYRAQHAVLGRPAAVKILRPELTTNDELVQRFLNEAKAATLIRHPGIIEVYDSGTTEQGISYLVMELLQGVPLSGRLAERGRLPEHEAVSIARGIASALEAAHREGIIHRDLKPENIFLVPDPDGPTGERIKVLDFGIAKLLDPARVHHTQAGALIGTPIYMAPEQARAANAIDHRADLYSLGCMLHELLVGRPPFVAMGADEIIAMHLFTPPEPPSRQAPVSPELDRIVLRLLEKEPQARFQDAGELIDALDALGGHAGAGPGHAGRPSGFAAVDDSRPYAVPQGGFRLSLADEQPMRGPEKKSAMGLVAGAITVAIAAAVAVFIATRGGGDEAKPAAAGSSEHGAAGHEPAATPTATPAAPAATPATPTVTPATPATTAAAPTTTPRPAAAPTTTPRPAATPPAAPVKHAGAKPPRTPPADHAKKAGEAKPGSSGGPVTHPDGPVTKPDPGGPVTSPSAGPSTSPSAGPSTSPSAGPSPDKGSPIDPGLDPEKKPPPADKLPDKPAEGTP